MTTNFNVCCAGSNINSKHSSFASAGSGADRGKGSIDELITIFICGLIFLYVSESYIGYLRKTSFAVVCAQTPTQLPAPLPTAEPTLLPSFVSSSNSACFWTSCYALVYFLISILIRTIVNYAGSNADSEHSSVASARAASDSGKDVRSV